MSVEQDAVNRLLVARGVTPVVDIDSGHPDVKAARLLLAAHKQIISGKAWWYNTETATLSPDSAGKIRLPAGVVGLDNEDNNIIISGYLYNIVERSMIFTEDVEDIVLLYDRGWEDMPVQPVDYITALAKEEFIRPLESKLLTGQAENDIKRAKALLDIADFRFKDVAKQTGNPLMLKWREKMLVR